MASRQRYANIPTVHFPEWQNRLCLFLFTAFLVLSFRSSLPAKQLVLDNHLFTLICLPYKAYIVVLWLALGVGGSLLLIPLCAQEQYVTLG